MPIRFRCVYCNQLLGIARRKAGKVVTCTSCGGQLIVPEAEAGAGAVAGEKATADGRTEAPQSPFEQSDFDAVLESAAPNPMAVASPPAPPLHRPKPATMPAPPLLAPPTTPMGDLAGKIVLSRSVVTLATGLGVVLLGLTFAGGLLVGMSMK